MKIKLTNVRLSFPDLFQATQYQGAGAFRYNATFLIEPGSANDKIIREAIKTEAVAVWKNKADVMLKSMENNSNKYCYLNGDTKQYDGYEGKMYLSSHRRQVDGAPLVIDQKKSPLTAADGKPYGGCFVNATVDIYVQEGTNSGVRCGLIGVQFANDGDSFSGAARPSADEFEELAADEASVV